MHSLRSSKKKTTHTHTHLEAIVPIKTIGFRACTQLTRAPLVVFNYWTLSSPFWHPMPPYKKIHVVPSVIQATEMSSNYSPFQLKADRDGRYEQPIQYEANPKPTRTCHVTTRPTRASLRPFPRSRDLKAALDWFWWLVVSSAGPSHR